MGSKQRSERIAEQLGMPHGTAANRLRKLVLFSLLQKHKENICFKCGQSILSADDLSLEHKRPWEGRDAKLFWDLENVTFSHLHCNVPESNGKVAKVAPPGMNWCYGCRDFLSKEMFHENVSKPSGLADRCKVCKSSENARRDR